MYHNLPSVTAMAVAAFRGLSDDPRTPGQSLDPYAEGLLPWPFAASTRALRHASQRSPWFRQGLRYGLLGLWDHLLLRTLAIDAIAERASAQGITQFVVLGAGLDARASRLASLASSTVWEIDHPVTQTLKARTTAMRPTRFVGVNFGVDDLATCLAHAGHNPNLPTTWVWEGVTPYLSPAATLASLDAIRRSSAPGSQLAVTYATPELIDLPGPLRPLSRWALRGLGEPVQGVVSPAVFAAWLDEAGFDVRTDTNSLDWSTDHGPGLTPAIQVHERLAWATRR